MPEETITQISSIVQNTQYFTWDVLVIVGFTLLSLAYFFTLGRDYVIAAIVAGYLAAFFMLAVPYINSIKALIKSSDSLSSLVVFFVFFLVIFLILKWNGFFEPYVVPTGFELVIFGLVFSGLMTVIITTFLSGEIINSISPISRLIFFGDIARTSWLLAPVGLFVLFRGET